MSKLDSTPIGEKTSEGMLRTLPMELSKQKGKVRVPADQESDQSLSDSSSSKYDSYNDSKCIKSRIKNESDTADDSKYSKPTSKKRNTKIKASEN